MMVYTTHFNRDFIQIHNRVNYLYFSKSKFMNNLFFSRIQGQLIQSGLFCIPQNRIYNCKLQITFVCLTFFQYFLFRSFKYRHNCHVIIRIFEFYFDHAFIQTIFQSCMYEEITYMFLRPFQQIYVSENTGHPKLILIL